MCANPDVSYSALARIIIFLCVNFRAWGQNFFATTDRPTDQQLERVNGPFFLVIFRHFLVILWSFYVFLLQISTGIDFFPHLHSDLKWAFFGAKFPHLNKWISAEFSLFCVLFWSPCAHPRASADIVLFELAPHGPGASADIVLFELAPHGPGASADIVLLELVPLETFTP